MSASPCRRNVGSSALWTTMGRIAILTAPLALAVAGMSKAQSSALTSEIFAICKIEFSNTQLRWHPRCNCSMRRAMTPRFGARRLSVIACWASSGPGRTRKLRGLGGQAKEKTWPFAWATADLDGPRVIAHDAVRDHRLESSLLIHVSCLRSRANVSIPH